MIIIVLQECENNKEISLVSITPVSLITLVPLYIYLGYLPLKDSSFERKGQKIIQKLPKKRKRKKIVG